MFNKALSTFVGSSLKELGMDGVVIDTFHGWALQRIRDAYVGRVEPSSGGGHEGHEVAVSIKKRLGTRRLPPVPAKRGRKKKADDAGLPGLPGVE